VSNRQGGLQNKHLRSVRSQLDAELTRQLLKDAPAAYRTQVNDLLLTALAQVISTWSGEASVLLEMEGHGREDLFDALDLTRSVGWFTSLYPVHLTPAAELGASVKAIKEQLRAIPAKGIGYGALRYLGDDAARASLAGLAQPRITFNYLGQFDASFDDPQALFSPADESAGEGQSAEAPLGNWLTLNGQVYGGELSMTWAFSGEMFDEAVMQDLADRYSQALAELVAHCCSGARGMTPSDFPLAGLDQRQLDALALAPDTVEDLYPLSPMQQGMLFHALYEQGSGEYINQLRLDLSGLDPQRFRQAWQAALDNHDILRTRFLWEGGLPQALQLVHKQVEVPFFEHDWRGRSDLDTALTELAAAEQRALDLGKAPLLRLQLVRTAEQAYHLVYTHHHILLDGWSNSLLLGEVLQHYNGQAVSGAPGRYRDYIGWLQAQDGELNRAFWSGHLAQLHTPTRLVGLCAADAAREGQGDLFVHLDAAATRRLGDFARQCKVTANTLVQAAWLLLLQRYTGQDTVCFGATVSGRPAALAGIEQQVGLFINTLPVIASPRADEAVGSWLQALQGYNLALREQEHTPLYELQRWSGHGNDALFDSLLVFENYPVSEALREEANQDLQLGELSNREQTSFPLTLLVAMGERLQLHFNFVRELFDEATVARLGEHLSLLLQRLALSAETRLGDIELLGSDEHNQQVLAWNANALDYPQDRCIHQQIEARAEATPDALALIDGEQRYSYAQVNAR
ncbi:condensation domain-containing protein, partial [Pseudomonas sp. ES1]